MAGMRKEKQEKNHIGIPFRAEGVIGAIVFLPSWQQARQPACQFSGPSRLISRGNSARPF